jgi:hypothetical protein
MVHTATSPPAHTTTSPCIDHRHRRVGLLKLPQLFSPEDKRAYADFVQSDSGDRVVHGAKGADVEEPIKVPHYAVAFF